MSSPFHQSGGAARAERAGRRPPQRVRSKALLAAMHGGTPAKAPAATPPRAPPKLTPSSKPSRGQALWARVARAAAVETLLAELVPAASSVDAGGEQAQRWLADRTARAAASLRAAELALSATLGHRASARELRDDAAAGAAIRRLEKLGALRDLGAGSPAVWVELLLEATDEGAKMGFRGFSRELLRVRQASCSHDCTRGTLGGVGGGRKYGGSDDSWAVPELHFFCLPLLVLPL